MAGSLRLQLLALSVHEILLNVASDSDDAERDLQQLAGSLTRLDAADAEARLSLDDTTFTVELDRALARLSNFARESATAEAGVDTATGVAELEALEQALRSYAGTTVSAEAQVRIAGAIASIETLRLELQTLPDHETIDIDVRRGVVESVTSLIAGLGQLAPELDGVSSSASGASKAAQDMRLSIGPLSGSLATVGSGAAILIPIIVSLGAEVLALAASLGEAIIGLSTIVGSFASAGAGAGILGGTLMSLLIPAFVLGQGAIANFTDESERAGTAAFDLARDAQDLSDTFQTALGPASHAIFRALSDAIGAIEGPLSHLRGEFTSFGQVVGTAIRDLAREFTRPVWVTFFETLIQNARRAVDPVTDGFRSLFNIMRRVIDAALPLVVNGLRDAAQQLDSWREALPPLRELRDLFRGMRDSLGNWLDLGGSIIELFARLVGITAPLGDDLVRSIDRAVEGVNRLLGSTAGQTAVGLFLNEAIGHLRVWADLAWQIARVFGNFLDAAAPAGREFAQFLADGAEALADWLDSEEGREQLRTFFEDVAPLAREMVELIGRLIIVFIQVGQVIAPILAPIVGAFNDLLSSISDILGVFSDITGTVGPAIGTVIGFIAPLSLVRRGLDLVRDAFGGLGGIASSIFNGARTAAQDAATGIGNLASGIRDRVTTAFTDVRDRVGIIWGAVRDRVVTIFTAVRDRVVAIATGIRDHAVSIFSAVRDRVVAIWQAVRDRVVSIVQGVRDRIVSVAQAIRDRVVDIFNAVRDRAVSIWTAIRDRVVTIVEAVKERVQTILTAIKTAAENAWNAIKDKAGAILGDLKTVVGNAFTDVKNAINTAKDSIVSAAESVWQGVKGALPDIDIKVGLDLSAIPDAILDKLPLSNLLGRGALTFPDFGIGTRSAEPPDTGARAGIEQNFNLTVAGGGTPDPVIATAQIAHRMRAAGIPA